MIPVKVFGDYVICFKALAEDTGKRRHFITDCGWTEDQYAEVRDDKWFCAEVSLWKDGVVLDHEYLGACCYKTEKDFYTTYAKDYFADMVSTLAQEVADKGLLKLVDMWRKDEGAKV